MQGAGGGIQGSGNLRWTRKWLEHNPRVANSRTERQGEDPLRSVETLRWQSCSGEIMEPPGESESGDGLQTQETTQTPSWRPEPIPWTSTRLVSEAEMIRWMKGELAQRRLGQTTKLLFWRAVDRKCVCACTCRCFVCE